MITKKIDADTLARWLRIAESLEGHIEPDLCLAGIGDPVRALVDELREAHLEALRAESRSLPSTVRDAARRRQPLDGADAQALEGALSQVEHELAGMRGRGALISGDRAIGACDSPVYDRATVESVR